MGFDFVLVDVFSDRAFGGNQLAVFPDATGIAGIGRPGSAGRGTGAARRVDAVPGQHPPRRNVLVLRVEFVLIRIAPGQQGRSVATSLATGAAVASGCRTARPCMPGWLDAV